MSLFIEIPEQIDSNGIRRSHETVINLDTVFYFIKTKEDRDYCIKFISIGDVRSLNVIFFDDENKRDYYYDKIKVLVKTEYL